MNKNEIFERMNKADDVGKEMKKIMEEISSGGVAVDASVMTLMKIADFMMEKADVWMELSVHEFISLICAMVDSYCSSNMILKDRLIAKVTMLLME